MKKQYTTTDFRSCFPIFRHKQEYLVYLDNAAMMQMPESVIKVVTEYNQWGRSNIHRGIYQLGEASGVRYEEARKTVATFINATQEEIVFTSGTTAGLSQMAYTIVSCDCLPGDEVVITSMEHHSNYLIWVKLCELRQLTLRIVPIDANGCLNLEAFYSYINEKTKIVSFTQMSNVTGIINPVSKLVAYIRKNSNSVIMIDGAQGVVHLKTDVKELDCDIYCFSGHKLGAPTGIGVVYMKKKHIDRLMPVFPGGGTVSKVTSMGIWYYEDYRKFEPGTPNIAGAIGLGETIKFLNRWDRDAIFSYEQDSLHFLKSSMSHIKNVRLLETQGQSNGIIAFEVDNMHPVDVAKMLDAYKIAVRSGHMCAQPYLEAMEKQSVCRVSLAPYNTREDLHHFLEAIEVISGFSG